MRRPPAAWRWARPSPTCWRRRSSWPRQAVGATGWRPAATGPARRRAVRHRARRSAWSCARRWASACRSARTACRCARGGRARTAQQKQVTAPVSLIVTAFATLDDVRGTLTPQLQPGDTTLVLIDLGQGRKRMGGSILAQVLGQFGDEVPDLDDPALLKSLVDAVNRLRAAGQRARLPRPQRRRPVGRGLRDGLRRPRRREPQRRPAGDRRRRHRRQPRRVRRRQELGGAGERAARGADAAGAVQRRARRR